MCMADFADAYNAFSRNQMVRARKEHKCCECGRMIRIGELYQYAVGLDEGSFWTAKTCRQCVAGQRWLLKHCRGFLHHGVFEDLQDHLDDYDIEKPERRKLLRIVNGMKQRWQNQRGATIQ